MNESNDVWPTMSASFASLTTDVRQPWTNYVNNGNEYLINGAVVCSEYLNI